MVVVFPAPLGPRKPKTSPIWTLRLRPFSAILVCCFSLRVEYRSRELKQQTKIALKGLNFTDLDAEVEALQRDFGLLFQFAGAVFNPQIFCPENCIHSLSKTILQSDCAS